jgi:hypothetical protein
MIEQNQESQQESYWHSPVNNALFLKLVQP